MLYATFPLTYLATFLLVVTVSYAFPPNSRLTLPSSIATKPDASSSETSNNTNATGIADPRTSPIDRLPYDEPHIFCDQPHMVPRRPWDEPDCLRIAAVIEDSLASSSPRVWGIVGGKEIVFWENPECRASMISVLDGATDVFAPVLMAQSIRRVVEQCRTYKMGGTTRVGPRENFSLIVTNRWSYTNDTGTILPR